MLRKYLRIALLFLFLGSGLGYAKDFPLVSLSENDRILVLAPHPDDEALGAGGILQQAVVRHLPVKVVFLTYGDSNPWSFLLYRKHPVVMPGAVKKMGLIRREEAENAAQILGVGSESLLFLGYPDFGTMNIWTSHWNERPSFRAVMTHANKVPYEGAFRPGAPYKGEEIVSDLRTILKDFKPTKIFVSHPADHNGDHLANYLFMRIALWDEKMENKVSVYPYLIHHVGWPKPKGFHPQLFLEPPKSLLSTVAWSEYRLVGEEFDLKKAALMAHQTQYKSTPKYLLSFIRRNEIFGDFPVVTLKMNQDYSVFQATHKITNGAELPEELNEQERSSFVGVDWKFVRWEGDNLVISIELSKPLAHDVEAIIYIFGYSPDIEFKKMPKISVRLGVLSYSVYDQRKKIDQQVIQVKRSSNDVTIVVPISLLGSPDRILTSARTYLGNIPLDNASWVAVKLE